MVRLSKAPAFVALPWLSQLALWVRCGLLYVPSIINPKIKGSGGYSVFLGDQWGGRSVRHFANKAPIVRLNFSVCPRAIFGRVIAIDVNALNRKVGRVSIRKSPVSERSEIIPLIADRNPAPAVVNKAGIAWSVTTRTHILPDLMEPRFRSSMRSRPVAGHFCSVAAA